MSSQHHDVKFARVAAEIKSLARAVFDFEEWFVFQNGEGVNIQPTGHQRPVQHWDKVQDCIDDLRFRKLTRFTSLAGDDEALR